jgi:AcrR family transcriptional regulator
MLTFRPSQVVAKERIIAGRKHKDTGKPPSLREELKRHTRARLEAATVQMLRRHGFRAMTVEQIARAAGTTRTTFYEYFKSKGDLIHFLQEAFIEPEMVAISVKLDEIANPNWQSLRHWITEYSRTWNRIHLFLEAYSDALLTDPAVAATAIPNTYRVTAHMTNILSRFGGEDRERAHGKLVILLSVVSQMLSLAHAQGEDARDSRLLDGFTDLFWEGFFEKLPKPSRARVPPRQ